MSARLTSFHKGTPFGDICIGNDVVDMLYAPVGDLVDSIKDGLLNTGAVLDDNNAVALRRS